MINDSGHIVAAYNKVHLFDADIPEKKIRLKESEVVEKGKEILSPVDTPFGKIGLSIVSFEIYLSFNSENQGQSSQVSVIVKGPFMKYF